MSDKTRYFVSWLLFWPTVVRWVGGVWMLGRLWIVIHDRGLTVAWRQVQKWDWRLR